MLKRSRGQRAYLRERKKLIQACTEGCVGTPLGVEGELYRRLVTEAEMFAGDTISGAETGITRQRGRG